MDSADKEHEELIMRILSGELSLGSEELESCLREDRELRTLVDEVVQLHQALDLAADTAEQDVATSRKLGATGAENVRDQVHKLAAREPDRRNRSKRLRSLSKWGLAAAAALTFFLVFHNRQSMLEAPQRGTVTLGSPLSGLHPKGSVGSFGTFRWDDREIDADRFEVRVFDSSTDELVTMKLGLKETRWEPAPEHVEEWPSEIRWTVTAFDASGSILESAEASARLSGR